MTAVPALDVDGAGWGHVTGRFRALGHDFGVRTTNPDLGRYIAHVFSAFTCPGRPSIWYEISEGSGPRERPNTTTYTVSFGSEELTRTVRPTMALGILLWHVNQETVRRSQHMTLVHASAAAGGGVAGIFPAPMESGKTTLVAGLVRAGLRYLTDEAAAIDRERFEVVPFPKALSVDQGSWGALDDLRPTVSDAVAPFVRDQWQVVPEDIRPGAVAPPTPVRIVVFPRYQAGATTALEPVRRVEALRLLADSTFHFAEQGRRNFETLVEVARRSDCYRLTVGDLGVACRLVLGLFDDLSQNGGTA